MVAPLQLHQLLVGPFLLHFTSSNHNNLIRILDGLQSVSNHQQRLVGAAGQALKNLHRQWQINNSVNKYHFNILYTAFQKHLVYFHYAQW